MDKASIIGDAIKYIQDLQNQARDIKAEITALESNNECSSSTITADVDDNYYQSQDIKSHMPKLEPSMTSTSEREGFGHANVALQVSTCQ